MSARVRLEGLAEFRAALRALPDDLKHEAEGIVVQHATQAEQDTQAGYPTGPTGNLKRGMRVDVERSAFGVSARVRSTARHATIFEKGTNRRQTADGADRGRMPPAAREEAFIPKVILQRRRMVEALIGLVQRAGFVVSR